MIIVFFHVLYLIGKMVYENYHAVKRKDDENVNVEATCIPAKRLHKRHADVPETDFDDFDEPRAPRFSPPAYIQRYIAVQRVLADSRYKGRIKKVVDFGCSELGFVTHLKNTPGIEEIVCVDVDRDTLDRNKEKVVPLNADYLQNRPNPLTISVYEGSVTHRDKKLENSDAVVAIELIEHLYPDTLMDFPYNIFGYIKPLVAAITTPNADFNVLFPNMGNELRHWDHKFEWTRKQFEDWATNITLRYPEYEVSFQGIGPGPPGTEELGCCSQMAVFTRISESACLAIYGIEGLYKSVTIEEYPYRIDNRSDEEKILDEAAYYIRQYSNNSEGNFEEYPLAHLLRHLEKFYISATTLREILEDGGYAVIDYPEGAAVACPALSTFSDYEEEMENDDIEQNDEWPNFVREESNYRDEIADWETDNVENLYSESWDDECEIPAVIRPNNDESNTGGEVVEVADRSNIVEVELSWTRSLDTAELDDLEISIMSQIPSVSGSLELERLASFHETSAKNADANVVQNQDSLSPSEGKIVASSLESNGDAAAIDFPTSSIKSPENSRQTTSLVEFTYANGDTIALDSLCSMYLESSRNDEPGECPENITNPSFDCAALDISFEDSKKPTTADALQERLSLPCSNVSAQPQFASSPRANLELRQEQINTCTIENSDNLKSISQTSLQSDGNASSATSTSGSSFATIKKWYPPEVNPMYSNEGTVKLKGGNEFSDELIDDPTSESGEISPTDSFIDVEQRNLHVTRLQRQKAPETLKLRRTTSSRETLDSPSNCTAHSTSSKNNSKISAEVISSERAADERLAVLGHSSGSSRLAETSENAEAKPATPDAPETPPNSWSPEIMDSGYPNSSSTQDMTPEYDLSSIAQDRISDSESPSVAEAPRLGFLEHAEVENGDLANNNRDGEGNNMIAEAENDLDEDLQPLIDVLENDIENENDIYALENGFPMWLLRILEQGNAVGRHAVAELRAPADVIEANVHAAGDAGLPDNDEGFLSTSSENDDSEADDDNIEEISTESSEETIDWNASGDYH